MRTRTQRNEAPILLKNLNALPRQATGNPDGDYARGEDIRLAYCTLVYLDQLPVREWGRDRATQLFYLHRFADRILARLNAAGAEVNALIEGR